MTEKVFAKVGWKAPSSVRIEGETLIYSFRTDRAHPRTVRPTEGMLSRFVSLGAAESQAIGAYAARWGVLEICKHGFPATHNPPGYWEGGWGSSERCYPLGFKESGFVHGKEPVAAWRQFASEAKAILSIAADLQSGKTGAAESWSAVGEDPAQHRRRSSVVFERQLLTLQISRWLRLGNVRPQFAWTRAKPDLLFESMSLFGALATQLLFTFTQKQSIAVCTSCGEPYLTDRLPPSGRNNFCGNCGIKAARRLATQAFRARQREKKGRRTRS